MSDNMRHNTTDIINSAHTLGQGLGRLLSDDEKSLLIHLCGILYKQESDGGADDLQKCTYRGYFIPLMAYKKSSAYFEVTSVEQVHKLLMHLFRIQLDVTSISHDDKRSANFIINILDCYEVNWDTGECVLSVNPAIYELLREEEGAGFVQNSVWRPSCGCRQQPAELPV